MDRDTVVRLARQAGFHTVLINSIDGDEVFADMNGSGGPMVTDELARFATLIQNETLERAAKVCEESGASKYGCFCSDAIRALKE